MKDDFFSKEFCKKQMQMVLDGKDISFHHANESDNHYEECNWQYLTPNKQLLIRKWVRFMFSKTKCINYHRTSYGLKHSCESDVGFYVHNDAMKKAFILEGFEAKTGRINWFFNTNNKITQEKSNRFKEIFKEEIESLKED